MGQDKATGATGPIESGSDEQYPNKVSCFVLTRAPQWDKRLTRGNPGGSRICVLSLQLFSKSETILKFKVY